jgi:ribosome maturation factor RimP
MNAIDKIREMADQVCKDQGIDLFDVEITGSGKNAVLRVLIDCSTGITVEDCAKVSRELSAQLDVLDLFKERYRLEVSSPGLDRPIRNSADAGRLIGKLVKVKTKRDVDGRKNFKGRLVDVREETWTIVADSREYEIQSSDVEKANLIFEFEG